MNKLIVFSLFLILLCSCSEDSNNYFESRENIIFHQSNRPELTNEAVELINYFYNSSATIESFSESIFVSTEELNGEIYEVYILEFEGEVFSASYNLNSNIFEFISMFGEINIERHTRSFSLKYLETEREITVNAMPIEGNCEDEESCIGCHYRVMIDAIDSNGDTKIICDLLDSLGNICSTQVLIAATIHCITKH